MSSHRLRFSLVNDTFNTVSLFLALSAWIQLRLTAWYDLGDDIPYFVICVGTVRISRVSRISMYEHALIYDPGGLIGITAL